MKTALEIFLETWNNTHKIDFKSEWKNTTGYLDHATDDLDLNIPAGVIFATTDDIGRKVLIKGLGNHLNHVLFERGRGDVLVSNLPHPKLYKELNVDVFTLPYTSSVSKNSVEAYLGLREHNVVFYPEFSSEFLQYIDKNTAVSVGTQLVKDIQEGTPILVSTLKEVGINLNSVNIYFNIRSVDV
jgi:hypothetical protein